jgi:hypothetical protein
MQLRTHVLTAATCFIVLTQLYQTYFLSHDRNDLLRQAVLKGLQAPLSISLASSAHELGLELAAIFRAFARTLRVSRDCADRIHVSLVRSTRKFWRIKLNTAPF